MSKTRLKSGIYIPEELLTRAEKLMKQLNIKSRSKLVQEALKLFISENMWRLKGRAAGVIGVVYRHEVKNIDKQLTEIQHEHLNIIPSALHIHLDKERCMLIIAVRGPVNEISKMIGKIYNLKGVEVVRPLLLASEETIETPQANHESSPSHH